MQRLKSEQPGFPNGASQQRAGCARDDARSIRSRSGLVTFGTAPALGIEVTADFEFDVPVRFDTDHMAVTIESYRLHNWQQIPIVELRT
jgi:uncharacterized protein (TIGR02217 family)